MTNDMVVVIVMWIQNRELYLQTPRLVVYVMEESIVFHKEPPREHIATMIERVLESVVGREDHTETS